MDLARPAFGQAWGYVIIDFPRSDFFSFNLCSVVENWNRQPGPNVQIII